MTTLTLTRAPLPHPKSLAQQIFEPAQVNHEAVIFICETCERRGFFPPGRSPSIQWLSRRGAGRERRCRGGPVPAPASRRASPRVPRRRRRRRHCCRRRCALQARAVPGSRRGGTSRGHCSRCRIPAWPREAADMHNLQSKLPLPRAPLAAALLCFVYFCETFTSVVCLCGCVSEAD